MRISDWSSDVCSSDLLLEELRKGKAGVADGKALICSLQGIRPPRDWKDEEDAKGTTAKLARFLHSEAENEPLIDMVIIDESHYLRNPETDRKSTRLNSSH